MKASTTKRWSVHYRLRHGGLTYFSHRLPNDSSLDWHMFRITEHSLGLTLQHQQCALKEIFGTSLPWEANSQIYYPDVKPDPKVARIITETAVSGTVWWLPHPGSYCSPFRQIKYTLLSVYLYLPGYLTIHHWTGICSESQNTAWD
jgi:hypothetical protein